MSHSVDEIAFYVLCAIIFWLTILSVFLGERRASIVLAIIIGVSLVCFLLLGVVAKDIPSISLPMEEIAIFFFGFLKALVPSVWLLALLHRSKEKTLEQQ